MNRIGVQSRSGVGLAGVLTALAVLAAGGCNVKPDKAPPKQHGHAHDHPAHGPHDGALGEWGDEEYHVEFTVDHKAKEAVVYVLDGTAKKAPKVDAAKITGMKLSLKLQPPVTIDLKHDSARSNDKGIAFAGTHEALGKEMEFAGSIAGKVDGKDFAGDFAEKAHDHKHDHKHEKK